MDFNSEEEKWKELYGQLRGERDQLRNDLAEAEKQIVKWQRVADGIERACQAAEADRDKLKERLEIRTALLEGLLNACKEKLAEAKEERARLIVDLDRDPDSPTFGDDLIVDPEQKS